MADGSPSPPGTSLQDAVETAKSLWAALVAPTGLVVAGSLWAGWKWLFARSDGLDAARAKRVEAEAQAEAAERKRQDAVDAAQIQRLTEEIGRKDRRIVDLELDVMHGWNGLRACMELYRTLRHDANANAALLSMKLEAAGAPVPDLREMVRLPDIDELTGRKQA